MRYYQAQDTFVADTDDGGSVTVTRGQALPEDHPLVQRDMAAREKDGGTPLFTPLAPDEDEEKPKPARRGSRGNG